MGAALPIALGAGSEPPEWVTLIPAGTFQTNDGRGPFNNTDPDQVIANTKAWLGGRDAPADYDHLSEYIQKTGQPSIAAGWIKDWRVDGGAIQAKVEWTKAADQKIRDKEYRYLSPVFATDKKSAQVVQLYGFALTNTPAINDLPAIAAAQHHNEENDVLNKLIASALGLAETSTDAEIIGAVTGLKKNYDGVIAAAAVPAATATTEIIVASLREKPDTAKWIAASEHQRVTTELATANTKLAEFTKKAVGEEAERVIAAAINDGKILPSQKDYWTNVCASSGSADSLKEYLKTAVPVVAPGAETRGKQLSNATVVTAAQLNAEELAHCKKFGLAPESYARTLTEQGVRPLAA